VKRWKVGKRDWHSWALGSLLVVLFLVQLLVMPHAVRAATTFDVTVAPVNVAPSFTKGPDQTVLEDCGSQAVSGWATSMSAGPADEAGQALDFMVTNDNTVLFAVEPVIAENGSLTYTPAANGNGTATMRVSLHDNGGTADGGVDTSALQAFTITVTPVNDTSSFTKGANQTVLEDCGPKTVAGWATNVSAGPSNESGQTLNFNVTNSNNSLFAVPPAVAANGNLTYSPAANANGTATVTLTLTDDATKGGPALTTAPQTFTITVNPVNDVPSFLVGLNVSISEDGAYGMMGWATSITTGTGDPYSQTLTFRVTGNSNPALFAAGPVVQASGRLSFTTAANKNGIATITLVLHDDGGTLNGGVDTSTPQTFIITVTPVNDAPSFTKGANQTVLEDCGPQTVSGWATSITAGPADEAGQTLDFMVTSDNNGLFSVQPAIAANGTLTYTPVANGNGTATMTISLHDNGGAASGSVDTSAPQMFTITVTAVNDPPVDTYTLTYTTGMGGTISGTSSQTVNQGASGTLVTATPNVGYHFVSWSDAIFTAARTDINVMVNINTTATFAIDTLTITPSTGLNGSISPSTVQTVDYNGSFIFTMTPNTGYHVQDVLVDGSTVGVVTSYTFTNVTAAHTIAASFAIDMYTLTYTAGANGTIAGISPQTVNQGASGTTVTAVPSTGYHFVKWSDDIVTAARTDINVTMNVNVTATFAIDTFTITPSTGSNGSISPSTTQIVDYGSNLTFTISPSTGCHVSSILVDGAPATLTTAAYAFTNVTAGHTIAATFAIDMYTIVASADLGGNISPSGNVTVNHGASQSFTINPGTGYHVLDILVDGSSVGAVTSYTFMNLTENHTIAVTFAINPITISTYTLTYTAGANGTISGTSPQTVNQGASSTAVTATPNGGYHFVSWSDGSLTAARTDTNVTVNVNVSASFAININIHRYTLTANVSGSGSVAKSLDQPSYTHGTSVQLKATPATGWHFVGWSGDLSGTTNPATITMDVSKTVTATYAPLPHPVSGQTIVLTIGSKTMTVDSARVVLDAPATLLEDRTLVPLRPLVEHLGGTISWNAKTRQVTLKARGTTIVLTIGKSIAFVNDKPLAIDPKNSKVVPLISSGRTLLPLRFVAENLGLQVGWDAKARTITVSWKD